MGNNQGSVLCIVVVYKKCSFQMYCIQTHSVVDSTYYYGNGVSSCSTLNQNLFQRASCALDGDTGVEARSPMAATRANSGASAASPIGSACMKTDINPTAADLLLG